MGDRSSNTHPVLPKSKFPIHFLCKLWMATGHQCLLKYLVVVVKTSLAVLHYFHTIENIFEMLELHHWRILLKWHAVNKKAFTITLTFRHLMLTFVAILNKMHPEIPFHGFLKLTLRSFALLGWSYAHQHCFCSGNE